MSSTSSKMIGEEITITVSRRLARLLAGVQLVELEAFTPDDDDDVLYNWIEIKHRIWRELGDE